MGSTLKTIILILLHACCLWGARSYSQTNLVGSIGIEFSKLKEVPNAVGFRILDTGYDNKSLIGGLRIEQKISESIFISVLGTYTEKKVNATDRGIVPFDGLTYKKIDIGFTGNWIPVSTLSVGAGLSHNFVPSIKKVLRSGYKEEITGKRREFGGLFILGYSYKSFLVEFNYYNGFKVLGFSRKENRIEPQNSIGLSLSYIFSVSTKRNKKKNKKKNKQKRI